MTRPYIPRARPLRISCGAIQWTFLALLASVTWETPTSAAAAKASKGGAETDLERWSSYQEEVYERTLGVWPTRFKHGYAHYSGPMMEEYFFGHWSKRRPTLPQIYLPIGWSTYFFSAARVTFNNTEVSRAKNQVEDLLQWLDKRYSYFSVVQFAGLIRVEKIHIPCDLKLTLFIGGGIEDNSQAPHLRFVPMPLLSKILTPPTEPRSKRVTFAGGFLHWQDPGGLRSEMRALLNGTEGFHITDREPNWEALIRSSDFHLCPRGNGPTSYRMYESLEAETIPIYIWSEVKWIAFEDEIDWSTIAIVVHRDQMATIPALVAAADVKKMRASIKASQHMWRYKYTSNYIIRRVNGSRSEPGITTYSANSTACAAASGNMYASNDQPGMKVNFLIMLVAMFLVWFCGRAFRRRAVRKRLGSGGDPAKSSGRNGSGHMGKHHVQRLPNGPDKLGRTLEQDFRFSVASRLELDGKRDIDV